jgi:Fe-S cluster biosynthesis and repair protein YggX
MTSAWRLSGSGLKGSENQEGKRIWEGVSKQAWADWLKHQTMLVNENRLNLADLRARQYLARQMENHFFGDGADAAQGYVPPAAG